MEFLKVYFSIKPKREIWITVHGLTVEGPQDGRKQMCVALQFKIY